MDRRSTGPMVTTWARWRGRLVVAVRGDPRGAWGDWSAWLAGCVHRGRTSILRASTSLATAELVRVARTAAKIDTTQPAIVKALEAAGWSVLSLAPLGYGAPDILASHRDGTAGLMEVKTKGNDLTPDQRKFHAKWKGNIGVAYSAEQALALAEAWQGFGEAA